MHLKAIHPVLSYRRKAYLSAHKVFSVGTDSLNIML